MIKQFLYKYKNLLLSNKFLKNIIINSKIRKNELILNEEISDFLNCADKVVLNADTNKKKILVGLVYDGNEYHGYHKSRSYYPKFERFLKNNNIEFFSYDIWKSDWIEKAASLDCVVWHTDSNPLSQEMAKSKLYVLDKLMKKNCLPSFDEVWSYENKMHLNFLYTLYKLPQIPTFTSYDYNESLDFIRKTNYPIISKIATGSGSAGVEKINSFDDAKALLRKVFGSKGRKTYFPYERQKDYVCLQQYIDDATYDLRIIVIGNKLFGYYRYPKKGGFKASGAGIYEKKEIPVEALDLAYLVKEKFGCRFLATDLLYSKKDEKYYIIESSIFIGVDTCEQLVVDGIPGYYQREKESSFSFHEGKYWLPELMLKEVLANE